MRMESLIAGVSAICMTLVMAACSKEGKARSAIVAGCMSQGATRDVCMCAYGKLRDTYGVATLVAMDEKGVVPPDFSASLIAVGNQCSSRQLSDNSSGLMGVGGRVGSASIESAGANSSYTGPNVVASHISSNPGDPLRVVSEFGDVLELDSNGLPELPVSMYGARGLGFGEGALIVAKQIGDDGLRRRFCDKYKDTLKDTE